MKRLILSLVFAFSFCSLSHSQFTDENGEITEACDCKEPIHYLDYKISLPSNFKSYDYIQVVAYRNGTALSYVNYRPSELQQAVKLNLLNPKNKAMRTMLGKEYGRYRGNDLANVSYSSMCEYLSEAKLSIASFGISQVGTETTYELQSDKTTVRAKTVPIYDGGEELTRSKEIAFKK